MKLPSDLLNKKEWVILGPMGPILHQKLTPLPRIGVDGGAHFSDKLHLWIGDADSYKLAPQAKHVIVLPENKDASDLSFSLNLFHEELSYTLHLWGFLGGRQDHELFNLGEAMHFLDQHPSSEIFFYDQEGHSPFHLLSQGEWSFEHHGLFSVGSFKKISLKMTGACEYEIPHFRPLAAMQSLGLSNRAQGRVTIETDGPLFIYKVKSSK